MHGEFSWSTRDLERRQVSGYWSKALDHIMPGLEFEPVEANFTASLRQRIVDNFRLSMVCATPQKIVTRKRSHQSAAQRFALVYVKSGLIRAQQNCRLAEVAAGECVLLDGDEPCEVITCRDSETLNVTFSDAWIKQWLVRPESEVTTRYGSASTQCKPLLDLLALLADEQFDVTTVGAHLLANQLGGALAIAIGAGHVVGTNHAARLLNRLRQGIEANYMHPDYNLQKAADALGISRRYVVGLFCAANTTFNTELMRVRIERSVKMLCSPRFVSLSVMDISFRCGFSDVSHFSKRFRAHIGQSPACYRAMYFQEVTEPQLAVQAQFPRHINA